MSASTALFLQGKVHTSTKINSTWENLFYFDGWFATIHFLSCLSPTTSPHFERTRKSFPPRHSVTKTDIVFVRSVYHWQWIWQNSRIARISRLTRNRLPIWHRAARRAENDHRSDLHENYQMYLQCRETRSACWTKKADLNSWNPDLRGLVFEDDHLKLLCVNSLNIQK